MLSPVTKLFDMCRVPSIYTITYRNYCPPMCVHTFPYSSDPHTYTGMYMCMYSTCVSLITRDSLSIATRTQTMNWHLDVHSKHNMSPVDCHGLMGWSAHYDCLPILTAPTLFLTFHASYLTFLYILRHVLLHLRTYVCRHMCIQRGY